MTAWRAAERRAGASGNSKRYRVDRFARRFVALSGMVSIGAILAILLVIAGVVWPLLRPASAHEENAAVLASRSRPLAVVLDEYRSSAVVVTPSGVGVVSAAGVDDARSTLAAPEGTSVTSATSGLKGQLALGLSDGRVLPVETSFEATYLDGKRALKPVLTGSEPMVADESGRPVRLVALALTSDGPVAAAVLEGTEVVLLRVSETKPLVGEPVREVKRESVALKTRGDVTALALDGRGDDLFVGTATGQLLRVDLRDRAAAPGSSTEDVVIEGRSPGAITVLGFLNGDRTLVMGDQAGAVSTWQVLLSQAGERRTVKMHAFAPHPAPVTAFAPSRRDKGFATTDAKGGVALHYATSARTLLTLSAGAEVTAIAFAPKADGLLAATASGRLVPWRLENPHPEVTWGSLFGQVWYEGYDAPAYVWQSTGGTDDFEAKLSLVPLIFGTLKGTLYAMLVAVPLALLGALYTAQFMHPDLKSILKPTVEIMAALPSVVLGFIAGLWLAPQVEKIVPGLAVFFLLLPVTVVISAWLYHRLAPPALRARLKPGHELGLTIPVVIATAVLSIWLGHQLEIGALGGDYRQFLLSALGVSYDQRNSLVVGLAMGFAVIPIIFTVAEDSIASVPPGLTAGSLALGATRWQTAMRTVLPTASPGIFSAVMIGFGRAVGETMIVLMATGNTPVMNWSIWSGFRALSANIAVELPEAPEGGTLFRVLFLAALLLYAMTFAVNTAAELVRLRLRKKYRTFE